MQHSLGDLSGREALVTGVGVGIGRTIANQLAAAGTMVGVHCHQSLERAEETRVGIRQRG